MKLMKYNGGCEPGHGNDGVNGLRGCGFRGASRLMRCHRRRARYATAASPAVPKSALKPGIFFVAVSSADVGTS